MSKQANTLPSFLSFLSLLLSITIAFPAFSIHKKDIDIGNHPPSKLKQFTSEGHVLAFDNTSMRVVGMNRELTVEFVNANNIKHYSSSNKKSVKGKVNTEFENMTYPNLWDGIDLYYDKGEGIVRSTYTVSVGSKVEDIKLQYNKAFNLLDNGSLEFIFDNGSWTESPPIAWQDINGKRNPVKVDFKKIADDQIGFLVGEYDKEYPLVIDPTLAWHSFYGGNKEDFVRDIVLDDMGNIYLSGGGYSSSWLNTTLEPISSYSSSSDALVAKLDGNGNLIWYTSLGSGESDHASSIALDSSGNIYIGGSSRISWGNPLNPHSGFSDLFVAKLSNDGVLQWNTFYGAGNTGPGGGIFDSLLGLEINSMDDIYITGTSGSNWGQPLNNHSAAPFTINSDVYIAKLSTDGNLQWNTFWGSNNVSETSVGLVLDSDSNSYVVGYTGNITQPRSNDIFVLKVDNLGEVIWTNTFGSASEMDRAGGIAIDNMDNVYVRAYSDISWGAPLSPHPESGEASLVILKLNAGSGVLLWNTFLDGITNDFAGGIATDTNGNVVFISHSLFNWGLQQTHIQEELTILT